MLRYFEQTDGCRIVLDYPIEEEELEVLNKLFQKNYHSWEIEFGVIYSVTKELVELLYDNIFVQSKNIKLIAHMDRLHKYFYRLGFNTSFNSILKQKIIDADKLKVVLIGGSADSSSKIMNFVTNVKLDNLAMVIVQHVEPDKSGFFDEILQRYTTHKVQYVKDQQRLSIGNIYIAQPNKHLKISDGFFILSDEEKYNYARPSISISYESFSDYYKDELFVIQECGYAADGVDKLLQLKKNGSKIIIQDKDECEAKSMVLKALELNQHDYYFKQEDIIDYINFLNQEKNLISYLIQMVFKRYGYDFKRYNRDMIKRRLDAFMIRHGIKSVKNAVGSILFTKGAFKGFFLDVSINVTELFRHPNSYKSIVEFLRTYYKNKHSLKIWSAGCSSGEEPYSMAILLDFLGILKKSIIYATDFNSIVLQEAKNGIYAYPTYELGKTNFKQIGLKADIDDYIEKNKNFITIDSHIREKILFFQHNLVTDGSFNEFDIIICKNVIIYFDETLQQKVFQLFYDSLKFGGYLVLGSSEMIPQNFATKFEKISHECKVFKKVV